MHRVTSILREIERYAPSEPILEHALTAAWMTFAHPQEHDENNALETLDTPRQALLAKTHTPVFLQSLLSCTVMMYVLMNLYAEHVTDILPRLTYASLVWLETFC